MGKKNFLVIGLGNFGATVADQLARMKCRVTAIDSQKSKVQSLQEHVQMVVILGDATDKKFLENLELQQFDGVILSTGEDSQTSILITLYLKELGVSEIIVKANSPDHAKILSMLGATTTVIPEKEMAVKLAHSLAQPNLIDFIPLAGDFVVAELKPPARFVGKQLLELDFRAKYKAQVIAVRKAGAGELRFAPAGEYRIEDSDVLIVLGREQDIGAIKA